MANTKNTIDAAVAALYERMERYIKSPDFRKTVDAKAKKLAENVASKEARNISKALDKEAKQILHGNIFKRGIRKAGIVSLALGGVAAVGMLAGSLRGKRRYHPEQDFDRGGDELAALESALPAAPARTMMGMEPVPGAHAQRVLAARGQAPQLAAAQPAMTAVAPESVQDLNSPAPGR